MTHYPIVCFRVTALEKASLQDKADELTAGNLSELLRKHPRVVTAILGGGFDEKTPAPRRNPADFA